MAASLLMSEPLAEDGSVLIVGGGLAALRCAQGLRDQGFNGSITMVGDEPHLPYDRPPLSKQVATGKWPVEKTNLVDDERRLFTSTQSAGRSRLMMEASVLLTGSSLQQEQRRGDSQPELVLWRTMCGPMKMAFSWPRHSAARPSEWWLSEQDLLALKLHLLLGHSAMKSRCSKPLLFLCRQSLARNSDPGAQHSMSEMGQRC